MPNTNCLDGMKCPKCGDEGPFVMTVTCTAEVHDDGIDRTFDHSWEDDGVCRCTNADCRYIGKVVEFRLKSLNEKEESRERCGACGKPLKKVEGVTTTTRPYREASCCEACGDIIEEDEDFGDSAYTIAIKTDEGWERFVVSEPVYIYIKQLEIKLNTPDESRLFDHYPERFAAGIKEEEE